MGNFYDTMMNFVADHTKQEKPMKTESGVKYPASDYAFVPDESKPSGWKLRLSEGRPGNITIRQLGRAAAAFSPGGFRGRKVEIPSDKIAGVKRRIRSEYKKLDVKREDMPASIKEKDVPLTIWKEKDGTYKFLAVYSNNFRDNDNPPEIIAEKSHKRFDEMLSKGDVDYPEAWLWHVPEWKFGQVTAHAYDDSGFPIAIGNFDKGTEFIAEWLMSKDDEIRVSHGMPASSIVRDENDASIIVEHITREVSPLPAWAAANPITGFVVLKEKEENTMTIPVEKRELLIEQGLSTEKLDALEQANAQTAQQAKESGLESKETANESAVEEAHSGDSDTPEVVPDETVVEDPITREEIAEAINESSKQYADAFGQVAETLKTLSESIGELKKELGELQKADSEKVAEKAAMTPAASLSVLEMLKAKSVIGSSETEVADGEFKGPKEAPNEKESDLVELSPIPFINAMLKESKSVNVMGKEVM